MEKEFVPYELAVKLKALDYDEPCFGYYYTLNGKDWKFAERADYFRLDDEISIGGKFSLLAPTFSQAFRWFREKYGLGHMINGIGHESFIMNIAGVLHIFNAFELETYEEAELACLTKLIEIVENGK